MQEFIRTMFNLMAKLYPDQAPVITYEMQRFFLKTAEMTTLKTPKEMQCRSPDGVGTQRKTALPSKSPSQRSVKKLALCLQLALLFTVGSPRSDSRTPRPGRRNRESLPASARRCKNRLHRYPVFQ